MQTITTEEMVRYLYNEMSAQEELQFLNALESDWSLREAFETLRTSKTQLDMPLLSPRKSTVNAIMQYAEQSVGIAQ
jgi:hypothetical protein